MAKPGRKKKEIKSKFVFEISSDWVPTRTFLMDDYAKSVVEHAFVLEPTQSIAIPVMEMKKRWGWEIRDAMASSVRQLLKKGLKEDVYQRLSVHLEKDHQGALTHIRVRRVPEA